MTSLQIFLPKNFFHLNPFSTIYKSHSTLEYTYVIYTSSCSAGFMHEVVGEAVMVGIWDWSVMGPRRGAVRARPQPEEALEASPGQALPLLVALGSPRQQAPRNCISREELTYGIGVAENQGNREGLKAHHLWLLGTVVWPRSSAWAPKPTCLAL